VLHPDAAGIDVGASELFVAVPGDRDPEPVRSFPTFTQDLYELVDWLQGCGIRSVAMESRRLKCARCMNRDAVLNHVRILIDRPIFATREAEPQ
jgi:hypothetical protein